MNDQKIASLMPIEACKRLKSAQSIVVVGPTSSGKSTLIYTLVNHKIIPYISIGVGDKCQTTIIPCDFLFDERITKNEYFALQIRIKDFSFNPIHIKFMEMLTKLYVANGYDIEEAMDAFDSNFMNGILEPADASYHLGRIASKISIESIKQIVESALRHIDNAEESFNARVKRIKAAPDKRTVSTEAVRSIVMEDMWSELPEMLIRKYQNWLIEIGVAIQNRLALCMGIDHLIDITREYSTEYNDVLPYGGEVLQHLFDPYEPYSLIVENMTMVCRPREVLIHELRNMFDKRIPLRFCIRDTMGLNQISMDGNSMKDALDIALNCSPDNIILLMSLQERDDVIFKCCEAINSKSSKAKKLGIPINVIFTKADIAISNIINKSTRDTVELMQEDYTKHIFPAISSIESKINDYISTLKEESTSWLSIRYLDENIDPIQLALNEEESDTPELKQQKYEMRKHFRKEGLYKKISDILYKTQLKILPSGIKSPLFVTVKNTELPAVDISVDKKTLNQVFMEIQNTLTQDKATVNGYQITDTRRIHGQSVIRYYSNLQIGLGYTTNAYVYGNFSINMKGMLKRVLKNNIPEFSNLYESKAIKTLADNIEEVELDRLIEELDNTKTMTDSAFADVNPVLLEYLQTKEQKLQVLHLIFRNYFASSEKFYMVFDKVAFNLSYGNIKVHKMVNDIYHEPSFTYDEIIRKIQTGFLELFSSENFMELLAQEIGNAMTELVNKMFIII